jgi:hypothetical protein
VRGGIGVRAFFFATKTAYGAGMLSAAKRFLRTEREREADPALPQKRAA